MKAIKTILAASMFTAIAGSTMAGVIDDGYVGASSLLPTGARVEVGTTGYGAALQWAVNPYVGLALGYNGGDISWNSNLKIDGSKYDWDQNNKNTYLNAEIRPWGASDNKWAEAFYVAAGVAYLKNDYDLERRVGAGESFKVNHTEFKAGDQGIRIKGSTDYKNTIAPYLGVGYSPKLGQNWGLFAEAGAYYSGNPKADLVYAGGNLEGMTDEATKKDLNLEDALKAEGSKISNKNKYAWMPVAKVGVNFFW
ncbi:MULTISPECIES: ornithine uptake porin CarO [unclassified Acinetobacter]|uniref:ornithine uptake porin CarO n=1 Tax=unclassified Acinetobacter TaxID=196816 RepID=UPI0029347B86|nr:MULTISPECIES: ornithine uptake porin CarO [unclassified Acinetobacter]WOE31613.1 ornithine uptake porin CarO [Acinetobacter sp. SAAs470]WOE37078.1 ornithine uptake porin CarO [Acinetobacter sp. SAAs474]